MNKILEEDINNIANSEIIDWAKIDNHIFFITGATGLIGSLIVKSFLKRNQEFNANIKMYLLVQNKEKAIKKFEEYDNRNIYYVVGNLEEFLQEEKIDYIIHGAAPTHSQFFIEKPVQTLNSIVYGTRNLLELAKENNVKSMVYLSSMEMYGTICDEQVTEEKSGYIDILNARSSYSEGKRAAELYCYSYYSEYGVPVKIARIAQTFGPGISKEENRVYKYFADCIIKNEDIIIKSTGETLINFSYTVDTVIGILCLLLNGESGEAYNIVGEKTNINILDSAKWLKKEYNSNIHIRCDTIQHNEFAPVNKMILCNEKLKKIGWYSQTDIKMAYKRLIEYMRREFYNE